MTSYEAVETVESPAAASPEEIVRRIFESWMAGNAPDAVELFADSFIFIDQALELEFRDKDRLCDFFTKVKELFPDSALSVDSTHSCAESVTAEWTLTATRNEPFLGTVRWKFPIKAQGVSVVRVACGKVRSWTDYYDSGKSYRFSVRDFFSEWVEL